MLYMFVENEHKATFAVANVGKRSIQSSQISQSIICSRRWSSCRDFEYPLIV